MNTIVCPIKVNKSAYKNYCYLVINQQTKEALIIDPAWEMDTIETEIRKNKAVLSGILLTHHHFDHVNLAEDFAKKYDIPVIMSKIEIDYYDFSCHNLVPIEKPGVIEMAQMKIDCLFTPGHTQGAISYWIDHWFFSGDTLFIEGCGWCGGKGGDVEAMFDSLTQIKSKITADTLVYPGHSYGKEPGQPLSYLLQHNVYLQLENREEFIAFRTRPRQKGLFSFV